MSVGLRKRRSPTDQVTAQRDWYQLGPNLELGTLEDIDAILPADALVWGALATVEGAPSVADPLFGWYSAGDVATLRSYDGAVTLTYVTLDDSAASLQIGGAGVALTLASPTVTGTLTLAASVAGAASVVIPPGAAPTGGALVDGALWLVNATGWFGRRNGVTEQFVTGVPLGVTSGGTGLIALTTGDLWYASAANTAARLGIGATGAFVRVAAGLPSWSTLTLPNTLAAGRVLVTTATDTVGGLAPTSGRALVADGSSWSAGTLPFTALPTGASDTWGLGTGNTLTIANRTNFSDGIKVSGAYGLGGTTPANPRTVTGSRGANAALASLLTQLAAHGVIVDSTTV